MSVGREHHTQFGQRGELRVIALERAPAGDWTVAVSIDLSLGLPDGREVVVQKRVRIKATQQIGRRRAVRIDAS